MMDVFLLDYQSYDSIGGCSTPFASLAGAMAEAGEGVEWTHETIDRGFPDGTIEQWRQVGKDGASDWCAIIERHSIRP